MADLQQENSVLAAQATLEVVPVLHVLVRVDGAVEVRHVVGVLSTLELHSDPKLPIEAVDFQVVLPGGLSLVEGIPGRDGGPFGSNWVAKEVGSTARKPLSGKKFFQGDPRRTLAGRRFADRILRSSLLALNLDPSRTR